jgi:hypothetical protein
MMNLNKATRTQAQIQLLPRTNRIDVAYETIDDLHSAICESGSVDNVSDFQSRAELLNWLRDVIYTAQETITELESNEEKPGSMLRVISNDSKLIVLERAD